MEKWQQNEIREDERILAGKLANNKEFPNKAVMRKHFCFNGSGGKCFGGAKKWPALTLKVSFQVNEEEQRNELATLLERTVEDYLHFHSK